jgi:predicted RNase H-like nuclease (RuvC/YqgF family)
MATIDLEKENEELKNKIKESEDKIKELEEKLKTYTYNHRHKKYYDNNSEVIKEKNKNYLDKIKIEDPEKLKKYRHTAYLNRKAKLQKENE